MPWEPDRALRGALAGAAAAAVWAAQQPVDQRLFDVPYDDTELLGKLVTRGSAWPVAGLLAHVLNGAAFGAVYATLAPRLPVAPWVRGPVAGLAEHVASWPATRLVDARHPARDELPTLWGSGRAFAQATWRHLLFGAVLGELERRLNPPPRGPEPLTDAVVATNGHGSPERVAVS